MPDYKETKWANQIMNLQKEDGSWGDFHSLAATKVKGTITTERAIKRLLILGFDKEDEVIKRALSYMNDCLAGKNEITDRREKGLDWDIFTDLMLAVWIRRFTEENILANRIAAIWKKAADAAFTTGQYDASAYYNTFGKTPKQRQGRLPGLDTYYPIILLAGEIGKETEKAYYDYILYSETGYYYGFTGAMTRLPKEFCSKEASRYLGAVELYCEHGNPYCNDKLKFVIEWLKEHQNENGKWDMGTAVQDGLYFPLSDSWRTVKLRERDCTYRIERIISLLERK